MAYRLTYWESSIVTKDTHYELRNLRLKSIEEVSSLALPHNRPSGTTLITLDRTDGQSNIEKIVWEAGMDSIADVVSRPSMTNKGRELPISEQVAHVVEQHSEGAITYGEMIAKIVDLLPPPCDDASKDTFYAPLTFGINFALMAEREVNPL